MEKDIRFLTTDEEIKIFSDPYRMKIIAIFQASEESMTVKQVSVEMGEVPAKVHYHVKKLLAIDILVLDHIEVINGINAKFYKLVKRRFSINLRAADKGVESSGLDHITRYLLQHIDNFRNDWVSLSEFVKDEKVAMENEGLLIYKNLYISDAAYEEIRQTIFDIVDKHKTSDSKKNKYSFLTGLVYKKQ